MVIRPVSHGNLLLPDHPPQLAVHTDHHPGSLWTLLPKDIPHVAEQRGRTAYQLRGIGPSLFERFQDVDGLDAVVQAGLLGISVLTGPIMGLFCIILMVYAVVKVFFANLKRGGILLIQIAVGSLYMFSVPRGYLDGFTQWMKQIIALCLTAFLQSTILVAGLMVFRENALMGLGLMLSAGEVPRIAGVFGLDTSIHANLSSAVYTAQSAVNTTKVIAAAVGGK